MTVQKLIELLKEKDPKLQVFLDAEETDVTKMVKAIEAQIGTSKSSGNVPEYYPVSKDSEVYPKKEQKKVLVLTSMTKKAFKEALCD